MFTEKWNVFVNSSTTQWWCHRHRHVRVCREFSTILSQDNSFEETLVFKGVSVVEAGIKGTFDREILHQLEIFKSFSLTEAVFHKDKITL